MSGAVLLTLDTMCVSYTSNPLPTDDAEERAAIETLVDAARSGRVRLQLTTSYERDFSRWSDDSGRNKREEWLARSPLLAARAPGLARLDVSVWDGEDLLGDEKSEELNAVIVGGGYGDDEALLGVFMDHDPTDFGVASHTQPSGGELRTGMSEAMRTDLFDDSYDLSWMDTLPEDTRRAIARLRELLESGSDPIDRHFMFAQLECRLYHLRDVEPSALDDYDEACSQHDGEMATIRGALHARFSSVPLLETYRQQCIRQQKAKDYHRGLRWAERGLALYGNDAHSQDWIDDLKRRAAWFHTKLQPPAQKVRGTASSISAHRGTHRQAEPRRMTGRPSWTSESS